MHQVFPRFPRRLVLTVVLPCDEEEDLRTPALRGKHLAVQQLFDDELVGS